MTNIIEKIEEKELTVVEKKALSFADTVKALTPIKTADEYIHIGEIWKDGKALLKEIDEGYDELIKDAHLLHKKAVAKKAKYYVPAEVAVKIAKALMINYDTEQERIRRAEEDRLRKIEEKKIEDQRIADALAAEKAGKKEEAQAIIDAPVYVPPVVVPKTTPKMEGGPVYRTIWKFRIVNAALIPREYMIPNETMIGGVVRNSKGVIAIPGIEVYEERV